MAFGYKKIPIIYPIFYLLKGDYRFQCFGVQGLGYRDESLGVWVQGLGA